ncbi:MAG: caspase family protein [Verrucomicrobiota bacterium]
MRFFWIVFLSGSLCFPTFGQAEGRFALVIGNNGYPDAPLKNAINDAQAIRGLFIEELHFAEEDVVYREDVDRIGFFRAVETLKQQTAQASTVDMIVVYYAGHGMESLDGDENFLIPTDANLAEAAASEALLRGSGIRVIDLLRELNDASASGAKVFLMDCCRQRPAGRGVSIPGGGLAKVAGEHIPVDTLVILAAAPNALASDGVAHGPFTEALLESLPVKGQNLMEAFFSVSDRVEALTDKRQVPWMLFNGSGQIFRERSFLAGLPEEPEREPMEAGPVDRRDPVDLRVQLNLAKEELIKVNRIIRVQTDRYQAAVATINRLTNFKRTPVQMGTQAYYQCAEASKVIQEVEAGVPELKAKRQLLEERVASLE